MMLDCCWNDEETEAQETKGTLEMSWKKIRESLLFSTEAIEANKICNKGLFFFVRLTCQTKSHTYRSHIPQP